VSLCLLHRRQIFVLPDLTLQEIFEVKIIAPFHLELREGIQLAES
jgi:hypothetical protein